MSAAGSFDELFDLAENDGRLPVYVRAIARGHSGDIGDAVHQQAVGKTAIRRFSNMGAMDARDPSFGLGHDRQKASILSMTNT